jgi:(S)-2-hydroxyglutarate dehydrogenase
VGLIIRESTMKYDVCVVGGGLVGLATARALLEAFPGLALTVVDKEDGGCRPPEQPQQRRRPLGSVLQAGSLKARLCVEGRDAVYELSERVGIAAARSGKLVIASHESEIDALDELERRGRANGLVGMRRLGPAAIREFEPEAVGVAALHVPEAGIADYPAVAGHLAREIEVAGSVIRTGAEVHRIGHTADGVMVGRGRRGLPRPGAHQLCRTPLRPGGSAGGGGGEGAHRPVPGRVLPLRSEAATSSAL